MAALGPEPGGEYCLDLAHAEERSLAELLFLRARFIFTLSEKAIRALLLGKSS